MLLFVYDLKVAKITLSDFVMSSKRDCFYSISSPSRQLKLNGGLGQLVRGTAIKRGGAVENMCWDR